MNLSTIRWASGLAGPLRRKRHASDPPPAIVANGWNSMLSFAAAVLVSGCSTSRQPDTTAASLSMPVAAQWHSPLPHGGESADLSRWWAQFGDPVLLRVVEAGQQASATLAQAGARIAEARAARAAGSATLLPALDASLSAVRGTQSSVGMPVSTTASVGLQASWELDLFGANRAGAN